MTPQRGSWTQYQRELEDQAELDARDRAADICGGGTSPNDDMTVELVNFIDAQAERLDIHFAQVLATDAMLTKANERIAELKISLGAKQVTLEAKEMRRGLCQDSLDIAKERITELEAAGVRCAKLEVALQTITKPLPFRMGPIYDEMHRVAIEALGKDPR